MNKICPTCGQVIPPIDRRVCGRCKQPIRRGHKFHFEGSIVVHRNCYEPDAYVSTTAAAPRQENLLEQPAAQEAGN